MAYNIQMNYFDGSSYQELYPNIKSINITETVPVSKGGTNKASWEDNKIIYPLGNIFQQLNFPSSNNAVLSQNTNGAPYWQTMSNLGNTLRVSRIAKGTYIGTGDDVVLKVTFPFEPDFLIIRNDMESCLLAYKPMTSVYYTISGNWGSGRDIYIEWGKTITFNNAESTYNQNGRTYYYFIIQINT